MDTAKLFMNGNSQAVRLPKEYRFAGDEVVLFDALAEFPADTCLVRGQPAIEERTPVG